MSDRAGIIRRAVGLARTRGVASPDGVNALTATAGTDDVGLEDTANFLPRGASANLHRDQFLYTPESSAVADQVRLIAQTDVINTRYIHRGPDWSTAPANGERYLVLKDPPQTWNAALNEALQKVQALQTKQLAGLAGQFGVNLSG